MSRPVVCPQCGEELDIPSELRGREVRCATCRTVFTAAADSPAPPRATRAATGRPLPSRPLDDDRAPWDESPRRRRKSGMTWLWVLLLGGGGLTCLGCCGCGIFAVNLDNPNLVPHESQKGRFAAGFPATPLEAQRVGEDGVTRECTESTRELFLGAEETYFVHYRDLPAAPKDEAARQAALDAAGDREVAKYPGSRQESRTKTTLGGDPAVDVYVAHPDTSLTYVRLVLSGKRLYAVGISGPGLDPQSMRLKKFLDSFRVTAADEDRKK
jgi:hypothetical protein